MKIRFWTIVVLLTLAAYAPAWAAPATVQLRVEGASSTLFEGPVTTDGKTIDKGDGPHPCDGTSSSPPQTPGPTMTSALDDASIAVGYAWEASWYEFGAAGDFFVTKIGSDAAVGSTFWATVLNYTPTQVGGCQQKVQEGDDVLFAYGTGSEHLLRLSGPPKASVGTSSTVTVVDGKDGTPLAGASVGGTQTGVDGTATLTFASAGLVKLKAEAPDSIRSNALSVCVSESGTGDCGVPAATAAPREGKAVSLVERPARALRRNELSQDVLLRDRQRRELVLPAATATGAWNVRARREGVRPRSQP